jgi:hypothetical protein
MQLNVFKVNYLTFLIFIASDGVIRALDDSSEGERENKKKPVN